MGFNSGLKGLKLATVGNQIKRFFCSSRRYALQDQKISQGPLLIIQRVNSAIGETPFCYGNKLLWYFYCTYIQFAFRFFISCIFYRCYNKNYQQMRLFVLCLYSLFLVFSLHVSGLHGPIIRGISSCCFYATIWFLCWTRNNTVLIVTI